MLDSSTLKYKVFVDPRYQTEEDFGGGFSGTINLGTAKDKKKYLVKHFEMTDASNEYVASRLANIMGIPVAKAYLLTPDKRLP